MAYKVYIDNNYFVIENTSNNNRIEVSEPRSNVIAYVQDSELKIALFSDANFHKEFLFNTLVDINGTPWSSVSALQTWLRQNTSSSTDNLGIKTSDSFSIDAFGRFRVSEPFTLFDSKQLHDSQPLLWDDQEVSGSGTTTAHQTNKACTRISVSANTAGRRVRQTFQRFNYQPAKSHLVILTWADIETSPGVTKSAGYGDDKNGLFFVNKSGVMYIRKRSYTTGSAVNIDVPQSSWNLDKLDGTGFSGITINWTKVQIGFMDIEWLGVGRVRIGFVIDGIIYYAHEFLHANIEDEVYMSTPNLPVQYSIENDGTGEEDAFDHICSSVASEGGLERIGVLRHTDSNITSSLATGTLYAILGIRLKANYIDLNVILENISIISTTSNDQLHWELIFNPTVSGTFTYSDKTNSAVQIAVGSASNTVTGGYEIDGGFLNTAIPVTSTTANALSLGSAIDGTVDEIVLCVKPITNNITVQASMSWRELI